MTAEKKRDIYIDPYSPISLYIFVRHNEENLSTATGFLVKKGDENFLITNWHVVSGLDPSDNRVLSTKGLLPNNLMVMHHAKRGQNYRAGYLYVLKDENDNPKWKEHPRGKEIDVIALPISLDDQLLYYPLNLEKAGFDIQIMPAMDVSIIGFPLGLSAHFYWPVWKTWHITSEPGIDVNGLPLFYVDATTREGMSGSPVIKRAYGAYKTHKNRTVINDGLPTRFLGVYSGRVGETAEIGRVWKASVIYEILDIPKPDFPPPF